MDAMQLDKIKKATEVLPEKFISGLFYDRVLGCFCFYGWAAQQAGHDVEYEYGIEREEIREIDTWQFVERKFGIDGSKVLEADDVVKMYSGHPELVRNRMLEILEAQLDA